MNTLSRAIYSTIAALSLAHVTAHAEILQLSPEEAYTMSSTRELILIDVRTEAEWRDTGVAEGASMITLQDPDFMGKTLLISDQYPDASIGFICRSGGRSMAAAQKLDSQIDGPVYNVQEGMQGQSEGEGWIARGLPHAPFE